MHPSVARLALITLLVAPQIAFAQSQPQPTEIKGRWTYSQRATNTFALTNIKVAADGSFTAVLEWWTSDLRCAIKDDPVTGKLVAGTITWDYVTKPPCNAPYTVELARKDGHWEGTATSADRKVVAEVKAQ